MENKKQISIDKLNQLYTKLIKIFLNGTLTSNNPYITSFYHDPSPDEAYTLLQKILGQQINTKKDGQLQQNNANNMKKFQIKRAMTVGQEREYIPGTRNYQLNNQYGGLGDKNTKKMYTDFSNNINTISTITYGTTTNTNSNNNTNTNSNMSQNVITMPYEPSQILQKQTINKTQKLQRLTAKLTQIFQSNQKKISKYQQMSKYNLITNHNSNNNNNSNQTNNSNNSNQLKFARPVQIVSYKKY